VRDFESVCGRACMGCRLGRATHPVGRRTAPANWITEDNLDQTAATVSMGCRRSRSAGVWRRRRRCGSICPMRRRGAGGGICLRRRVLVLSVDFAEFFSTPPAQTPVGIRLMTAGGLPMQGGGADGGDVGGRRRASLRRGSCSLNAIASDSNRRRAVHRQRGRAAFPSLSLTAEILSVILSRPVSQYKFVQPRSTS